MAVKIGNDIRSDSLAELTMPQLLCHRHRHAYIADEGTFLHRNRDGVRVYVTYWPCERCQVIREDTGSQPASGSYISTYDYSRATGYLLTFTPTVEELNKEIRRRIEAEKKDIKRRLRTVKDKEYDSALTG